jgi:phospholipid/cholesterol/gamma-HCH transport system substrate-binding protein
MEDRSHALAAGLFTLLLVAALVAAVVWFGRDTTVRDRVVLVATT